MLEVEGSGSQRAGQPRAACGGAFTGRAGSPDLEGEDRAVGAASSASISGLRAVVECYRKHPALKNPLGMVIEQFSRGHHLALYARHLPLAMADAPPARPQIK